MAETHKGFIIGTFLIGALNVVLIILAFASGNWIVVSAQFSNSDDVSSFRYGLFGGQLVLEHLASPIIHNLYMTCVMEENACAVSCKTTPESRRLEVAALANGRRLTPNCLPTIDIDDDNPLDGPAVISPALYICLLVVLAMQLVFALVATVLALINVVKNPTEPVMGLPGVLWSNAITSILGALVLFIFGIYWAASTLQEHFAFSYTAVGELEPTFVTLGYSYWIIIVTVIGSLANVVLIEVRKHVLEKDPPPPTIVVENHSQGTIFLY